MKRKLLFAAALVAGALGTLRAQTDVTDLYIPNAGFEAYAAYGVESTETVATDSKTSYEIGTGWTQISKGNWAMGMSIAYGSGATLNSVKAPESSPSGDNVAVFFSAGHGNEVKFQQSTAITLPAGTYRLSYKVYNQMSDQLRINSLVGFVPTSGSATLSTKTYFGYQHWEDDIIYITLDADTEGKFQIGASGINGAGGSNNNAKIFIDGLKLEKCIDPSEATVSNPADMTYKVSNFKFDSNTNNWTTTTGVNNKGIAYNQLGAFSIPFWENWSGSSYTGKMYTTVKNLPNGLYEVGISAFVSTVNENLTQYVYANDAKTYLTSNTPTAYTIKGVHVTDGSLELGLNLTAGYTNANWAGIDNVSLTYLGDFIDVTKYVVTNNSFETGNLTGWSILEKSQDTQVCTPTGSHSTTGADGTYIFNTWWKGVPLTQSISNLPAGTYQVQALLASSDEKVNANIFLTANDTHELFKFPMNTQGTFVETSTTATLAEAGALTIGAVGGTDAGEYTAGGHWWYKADNFRVSYNIVTGGVLHSTLVDKVVATIPSEKMSASVLDALNTAKTNFLASATKTNLSALETAIDNAKTSINTYTEIAAAIEKLKEQNTAASFTEIDGKYTDGRYETVADLYADYNAAAIAALADDATDYTSVIVNPSFETGDITGWSVDTYGTDTGARETANATYAMTNSNGNYLFNSWTTSITTLDVYQTVKGLPAGTYTVSAVLAGYNDGAVITLYANSETATLEPGSSADTGYRMSTTVTIAEGEDLLIKATNTGKGYTFLKADDFTLTRYTSANKAEWEVAKANAEATITNAYYNNVTGSERTNLQTLIAAAEPATDEAYGTAATALAEATTALVNARTAYETLLATQASAVATYTTTAYPYAGETAKSNLDAATTTVATSAADAETKTAAVTTAYRAFVESNGLAEGVDGAINYTTSIQNPIYSANNNTTGWTLTGVHTDKNKGYTLSDGSKAATYYDSNVWGSTSARATMSQDVTIPAGKYLLSVTERGSGDWETFRLYAGDDYIDLTKVGDAGQTFELGWNDNFLVFNKTNDEAITIKVEAVTKVNHQWFSVDNFRLVRIANAEVELADTDTDAPAVATGVDVTVTRSLKADRWNTFCVPFSMDKPEGWDVKKLDASTKTDDNISLSFTDAESIESGVPYLVKPASDVTSFKAENVNINPTLNNVSTADVTMTGNMTKTTVPENSFFIKDNKFYLADVADVNLNAFRAYITPKAAGAKAVRFFFGGFANGIEAINTDSLTSGQAFDLSGRAVKNPAKGLYIVNGKKVLVK